MAFQDKMDVKAHYDILANQYVRNYINPHSLFALEKQRRLAILQGYLQDICPSSVLDLGCGPGYVAAKIGEALSDTFVVGVDFSSGMINVARRNYSRQALFFQGDAEKLPFDDERFPAIYALGLFEKFTSPYQALLESFRVLQPGGYLFFTYPNIFAFSRLFRKWLVSLPGTRLNQNKEVQGRHLLSVKGMIGLVDQIGYKVSETIFLTYGNSFVYFPWSKKLNLIMEKHWGKKYGGRALSMTIFWSLQKN